MPEGSARMPAGRSKGDAKPDFSLENRDKAAQAAGFKNYNDLDKYLWGVGSKAAQDKTIPGVQGAHSSAVDAEVKKRGIDKVFKKHGLEGLLK